MLALYHAINSVCAQKVRLVLAERQLVFEDHLMRLDGDQHEPSYLALNPNGVVPTLVHNDNVILESTVICHYLDEAFAGRKLMPRHPLESARVRTVEKLVDEHIHDACIVLTFAIAFRQQILQKPVAEREASFGRSPIRGRAQFKRDIVRDGLKSTHAQEAVEDMSRLVSVIDGALQHGPCIGGADWSLGDAAAIPYILRLELLGLSGMWAASPRVTAWWQDMRARQSTSDAIFSRMGKSNWAPFQGIAEDPWPQVRTLLMNG